MNAPESSSLPQAGCCGPGGCEVPPPATAADDADSVRSQVRDGYARIAETGQWSSVQAAGACCGPTTLTADQVAAAIGYEIDELGNLPAGANMGLSCGNPAALAALRTGEVVLDLGAGGGFDCFIAGPRVGATGRVIGVDMTPEMLAKARGNLAGYRERSELDNVEFRLGEIEHLPVADHSVDVVISNCVLNLSPDKPQVWREIARVLRPGGRVAISDIALLRPLPEAIRADAAALVGCVAGALLVDEIAALVAAVGLTDARLTPKPDYIAAMSGWKDPLYEKVTAALPAGAALTDYVTSLDIAARKA